MKRNPNEPSLVTHTHTHTHLVVHGVDPVGPQQVGGVGQQVGAAAGQQPEAQVQLELDHRRWGSQALVGGEAAL